MDRCVGRVILRCAQNDRAGEVAGLDRTAGRIILCYAPNDIGRGVAARTCGVGRVIPSGAKNDKGREGAIVVYEGREGNSSRSKQVMVGAE